MRKTKISCIYCSKPISKKFGRKFCNPACRDSEYRRQNRDKKNKTCIDTQTSKTAKSALQPNLESALQTDCPGHIIATPWRHRKDRADEYMHCMGCGEKTRILGPLGVAVYCKECVLKGINV